MHVTKINFTRKCGIFSLVYLSCSKQNHVYLFSIVFVCCACCLIVAKSLKLDCLCAVLYAIIQYANEANWLAVLNQPARHQAKFVKYNSTPKIK